MLAKKLVEKLGYEDGKIFPSGNKAFVAGVLDGIIIVGSAYTVYATVSIVKSIFKK